MKEKIFANIFFCEGVQENSELLDINGVFSRTVSDATGPFTILVNSTVYGDIDNAEKTSLYYILEANLERGKRYKTLKEVPLQKLDTSKDDILQDHTAFVFNNRGLIAQAGEYFVRVFIGSSNMETSEVIKDTEKKLVNSQVLIVE